MPKFLFILIILCITVAFANAQKPDSLDNWGEIQKSDLSMTHCAFDSSATAMSLQEVGSIELARTMFGWLVYYNYWNRIKIFDETALDKGNLNIYLRTDKAINGFEKFEVQVISPEGVVQKVDTANIFLQKISRELAAIKVFVPNLKKGCVIEYRYELSSSYIFSLFDKWSFQQDIPARWSQVTVMVPEPFTYMYLKQIPKPFEVESFMRDSSTMSMAYPYVLNVNTYGLSNMPAIKEEPYMTTTVDYQAQIGFQLKEIHFANEPIEKVMDTWAELAKRMIADKDFGEQYLKSSRFDKLWSAFRKTAPETTPKEELPEKILNFVSNSIKWDGENRVYVDNNLDAVFNKKSGSSAELNLAVVALLRKSGFDAVPMAISTRDHGRAYNAYPFVGQFNTIVAYVRDLNGGTLMDATHRYRPLGVMRIECYNTEGWLVDETHPDWIKTAAPEMSATWFGNLKINEEGEAQGHFSVSVTGVFAQKFREELEGKKEDEFMKMAFAPEYSERSFDSIRITDRELIAKPLKLDFNCRIANAATSLNDFLYVKPVIDFLFYDNPFKSLKRKFPVVLEYPFKAQYVLNLEIPQGYGVEETIPSARITLPNNGGKIQFTCGNPENGKIQIILKMNISQIEFSPEDYATLRQFFELLTEKIQSRITLKKQ